MYVHEDNRGNTWFYSKENGQGVFTDLEYDVWGMPKSPGKLRNNDSSIQNFSNTSAVSINATLATFVSDEKLAVWY